MFGQESPRRPRARLPDLCHTDDPKPMSARLSRGGDAGFWVRHTECYPDCSPESSTQGPHSAKLEFGGHPLALATFHQPFLVQVLTMPGWFLSISMTHSQSKVRDSAALWVYFGNQGMSLCTWAPSGACRVVPPQGFSESQPVIWSPWRYASQYLPALQPESESATLHADIYILSWILVRTLH